MPSRIGTNRNKAGPRAGLTAFALATALGMAWAPPAAADAKTCIRAHTNGQRESKSGHLRAASQLFMSCGSDDTCPDQLRKECAEFLESVKKTIPTVIFSALDENGRDLSGAKVYSGAELLLDGLDGRAFEMDPGKVHLRFVMPTGETLTTDVVIREGEKDRVVQVKKEKPVAIADTRAGDTTSVPEHHGLGPAPWIAAGVAVAALGAGVTLGVLGSGKESDLNQCKPTCSDAMHSTYDSARGLLLGADIGFGVAIVATGVATWLFVSGLGHGDQATPAPAAQSSHALIGAPVVAVVPGGGVIAVAGGF
jgi:hypothetical protein